MKARGSNASVVFVGDFLRASGKMPEAKLEFSAFAGKIKADHPPFQIQGTCGTHIFSAACGLSAATNTFTCQFLSRGTPRNSLVVEVTAHGSGSIPAVAEDFLAGGKLTVNADDRAYVATITGNTELDVDDRMVVTIDRWLSAAGLEGGDVLTLTMGCPGTYAACGARANTVNFRGFPFMPVANPANIARPRTESPSGKK
jgi:hypothetical protein